MRFVDQMPDIRPDPAVLARYGGRGPRYTSYPTADRFIEAFGAEQAEQRLRHRALGLGGRPQPLGLYVHIPFCSTACWYCACNRIATRDRGRAKSYIEDIEREIGMLAPRLGGAGVEQIHFGGGTPTFLDDNQLGRLVGNLHRQFAIAPGAEQSIEIDPRTVGPERVVGLAAVGFNRASLGVQDFDPAVQAAINRIQGEAETVELIDALRKHGFTSVNLDLIYGLPRQTPQGFARTLDTVIASRPDRIALYAYAHLPALFKTQRRIALADLPAPEVRLALMIMAIERLGAEGYVYIGMDHFAHATDGLALAQREGRLTRNFQGYAASGALDTLGLGTSAISQIGSAYWQNAKSTAEYHQDLAYGRLPVVRGVELGADDLVRRSVIQALSCYFMVSMESVGIAHLLDFRTYFRRELAALAPFVRDGLVEMDDEWLAVTASGRLVVRAICAVFDRYLQAGRHHAETGEPDAVEKYSAVV